MKLSTLLGIVGAVAFAANALAQGGTINAANNINTYPAGNPASKGFIYKQSASDPALINNSGNWTGWTKADANYAAEIWAAPGNGTLAYVATAPLRAGINLGTFNLGELTLPGTSKRGEATVQIRAFDKATGADWEHATIRGESVLIHIASLGGPAVGTDPAAPAANLLGLNAFNVAAIPEPSVIALGVLGLGALVLFRRRKN